MMLPFKMRTETPMEKYRAETFWEKEPETIAWIKSFAPTDEFVDIGANIGVYSLFANSLYPEMWVYAFEPMKENMEALQYNRLLNRFMHIACFWWAIGSFDGFVEFGSDKTGAGASGGQVGKRGRHTIISTLDTISKALVMDNLHVKIDIDGQELEVVRGMQLTLPYVKSALIEVSKTSKGPIMDIMTGAGFTTRNRFNEMTPHSRERREREGIDAENIVFTR